MQPKRSLGQNFFTNQAQAVKIVEHSLTTRPEIVIEIGPGTGSFTQLFAKIPQVKTIAIEKDDGLYSQLCTTFTNVKFVHADFLDLDLNKFAKENEIDYSKAVFYGSLPYNISKKIIEKCLRETKAQGYYFIIQKEVSEKYCQIEPNNNPISIYAHLFSTPKNLMTIKPDSFVPRPNVMSALIRFTPDHSEQSDMLVRSIDYNKFMKFVHMCFKQPRKTLRNNLKQILSQKSAESSAEIYNKRPEQLSIDELIHLYTTIY